MCGHYFPPAFIPITPETPFLTQLLDPLESVNNGTTDISAAVTLGADASKRSYSYLTLTLLIFHRAPIDISQHYGYHT